MLRYLVDIGVGIGTSILRNKFRSKPPMVVSIKDPAPAPPVIPAVQVWQKEQVEPLRNGPSDVPLGRLAKAKTISCKRWWKTPEAITVVCTLCCAGGFTGLASYFINREPQAPGWAAPLPPTVRQVAPVPAVAVAAAAVEPLAKPRSTPDYSKRTAYTQGYYRADGTWVNGYSHEPGNSPMPSSTPDAARESTYVQGHWVNGYNRQLPAGQHAVAFVSPTPTPTPYETSGSASTGRVYVHGYTRKNGTYVSGHTRSSGRH